MAPTLHRLLGDLATDGATKRAYHDDREGWLSGHGHDHPPELIGEAITHLAIRLPVEVAEQLSDYTVSVSPLAADGVSADPLAGLDALAADGVSADPLAGLDALAAVSPVGAGGGGGGGGGGRIHRLLWSPAGWTVGLLVATVVAISAWVGLRDDGCSENCDEGPTVTEAIAAPETAPAPGTVSPETSPAPDTVSPDGTVPADDVVEPTAPPTSEAVEKPAFDVTGTWQILITVTSAGECKIEDPPYTRTVTIEQRGSAITVIGLGDGDDEWIGEIDGARFGFKGSREEDGGTTTARFELEIDADQIALTGTEFWDWVRVLEDDVVLRCEGGLSTVTGTKLG